METKYIHKRSYKFFLGIFLVLLAIMLSLNVGFVARTLVFPFLYLFGGTSYLIFLISFIGGICLIANRKAIFGSKLSIAGLIILFFAINFLWTSIVLWNYSSEVKAVNLYNELIFGGKGYYNQEFINVFSSPYGGGMIGYLVIFGMFRFIGRVWMLILCILLTLVGLVLTFHKEVKILISFLNRKHKESVEEKERIERTKDITEFDMKEFDDKVILEQARTIGSDEVVSGIVPSELTTMNFDQRNVKDSTSIEIKENLRETGTIIKPMFHLSGEERRVEEPFNTPKPDFISSKETESNSHGDASASIEDVALDFEAKREFNEEILTEEPEFLEPVIKESLVSSENTTNEQVQTTSNNVSNENLITEHIKENEIIKKPPFKWIPPSTDLLNVYETQSAQEANEKAANERMACINQMFEDFKIQAEATGYTIGPSITRFHINYASNGLVKSVESRVTDLSVRLSGLPLRFEPSVPGFTYSGLEVPNAKVTTVSFKECVEALGDPKEKPFNVAFGKNITGDVISAEFDKFPHMLVSGGTGSGKSVFVNSIITALLMRASPEILRMVMVDPKRVEFNRYKGIPHLLCPVANEPLDALKTLKALVREMDERYRKLEEADGSTNIKEYNQYCERMNKPKMFYILAIIDEYADLIDLCKEVMEPVSRLAQKARACGIMLFIATQRPTVNIITGTIKANMPVRVALTANSGSDSMVILDEYGAEGLLGNGDMLVKTALISRSGPVRLQGCFIQSNEISHVVSYLKEHYPTEYENEFLTYEKQIEEAAKAEQQSGNIEFDIANANADKYEAIKEWVMTQDMVSMSKIQRYCGVGFSKAGKMFDRLVEDGIVESFTDNPSRGNKVLVHEDRFNQAPEVDSSEQIG